MSAPTTDSPAGSRWKCRVAYDGTGFSGWQSQPDNNAVQDHIERRLAAILGASVRIHGSGRTDAGVHARGQVFHFDADWKHGPEKLLAALRSGLPETIQVQTARQVGADFHARYSAKGKIYRYHLHHGGFADPFAQRYTHSVPRPLDVDAMRAGAARLVGTHDFRAYSAFGGVERESTVRTLHKLDLTARGNDLRIDAEGNGFLYKMVRSLAGALISVGQGKLTPDDLSRILAHGERTRRVETAPARGLCLMKVLY